MTSTSAVPLKYETGFEKVTDSEGDTAVALIKTIQGINETTLKDYGRAVRASFAKSFGLLEGELEILPGLSPELAQGLFATAARYPVLMRFSTAPGDVLPDDISTARGLAIKVIGVPGERLPGSEADNTQDFIFVDAPFFFNATPKSLLASLSALAATTDKVEGMKKAMSVAMRGVETALETVGLESSLAKHLGGQLPTHPLGDVYNTQAPALYGPYMAKFKLVPVSPELTALTDRKIELSKDRPDALREEVIEHFSGQGGEWELQVQLCVDLDKMPIEDPSVEWPEKLSPFVPVARLKVAPQAGWSEKKSKTIDDCMSFSPWHGLAAHRPIGAIMRARRMVYATSSQFRGEHNGCPMREPRSAADVKI